MSTRNELKEYTCYSITFCLLLLSSHLQVFLFINGDSHELYFMEDVRTFLIIILHLSDIILSFGLLQGSK